MMNKIIDKIKLSVLSRGNWTLAGIAAINGITSIKEMVPSEWVMPINAVLFLLNLYFKANPSQNYNQ